MKKSLEKIIRMPLLESLSNDVFRYGTVVLVEFEAHSLWYEAAYTIAAQALRDGIKTDFHIFQHPPEDVKEALRRQGVNLDETRVLERFRIIDSYTIQMGLERPKVLEPYGFATKSLKISDWMSQMFGVLRSADESNQIHIDENDSVLASYNTESELLDFFRRSYTAARGKRFMFVYALLAGVHSPSFYAQFESLADVVIDFARREEQGAERQYARIRIARGSPQYNSNWRALEILDNGGIELTKSGQHGLPAGKKTQTERKLAAIMFTDMVGYTTLAQSNEALALEILERHNKLLRRLFSVYKGREVKTIGDSFLVEFESALDAVQCAIEIQKLLHGRSISGSRENQKIRLRIGVHLGDVERKGGDIFGDAVNIASRIQPLASAEGVCISEQVFDQIHNKIDYRLERLDERGLKNVTFHTKVYSIILPWTEKKKGKITHDLDNSKR